MTLADRIEEQANKFAAIQAHQWPRRQQEDARMTALAAFLTGFGAACTAILLTDLTAEDLAIAVKDVADRLGFVAEKPSDHE